MQKTLLLTLVLAMLNLATKAQSGTPVSLRHLSTWHTAIFDEGAAEISAYDKDSKRLYFTNAFYNSIEILDIVDPFNPVRIDTIDLTPYGGGLNSIVVWDGYLAAAIQNNNKQLPGEVVFFDTAGNYLNQVTVGALPDMISITPDQSKIVVANEGEPDDDYLVDPNGSISIIDLSPGVNNLAAINVTTLDFSAYESFRQGFESGSLDNWNYTTSPAAYSTEADSAIDGNEDVWAVISEFTGDIDNAFHGNLFFGGQDLDNSNGGGAMQHTIDFEPINISTKGEAWVSFKYYSVGYESADSVGYIVSYDNGSTWDMNDYVELSRDTNWNQVTVYVPASASYVRLRLMARQNGSTDYVGFDDVKLSFLDAFTRIYGNGDMTTVAQDMEPEYICVSDDSQYAIVTLQENNAVAKVDLNLGIIVDVMGLGFKDHSAAGNGIDASNTASGINITNWPVKGIYTPDALDCYSVNGVNYYVTANEGDSRDYDGYSEEERVKDVALDSMVFPNYATLQNSDELGRLKITTSIGDLDADGEFEELYSYGGRSFSIFDTDGNQVYDSGDDFEQITAAIYPNEFNSTNDDNTSFKNRSDDKGPEPEGLVIGTINGRDYAFIGLERMGGIMVYDITDPQAVSYVQYLNNRDFSQNETDSAAGDLAPEGLIFVPKEESPNHRDLLIVSNEVSGTVSIFQIDINNTIAGDVSLDTFCLNTPDMIGVYGDTIYEGGISGLHYVPNSGNEFYMITDRGPNVGANNHPLAAGNSVKFFPFPTYAPKVMEVSALAGELNVNNVMTLKRPDGSDASGIPLPVGAGATGEIAWSDTIATVVAPDIWGIDSEGILLDNQDNFWVCEEYGASVWSLDQNMTAQNRYTPFATQLEDIPVDTMIGKRRPNRGFEGVANTPNGKIYAILQSPVYNPSSAASDNSRIHRILEIDPATGQQQMFAYEHEAPIGEIRNKDWKIGDLVAINNNEFLVLEHAQRLGWNYKDVYKIDISSATPITQEDFGGLTLEELIDSVGLAANGITTVSKTHVLDLLENGWNLDHDKPEGITVVNDSTIAIVNDNDYGITSPNEAADIAFTGNKTQLYIYHLPMSLNYVSPYCTVSATPDQTVCVGEDATFNAPAGWDSYLWSNNDATQSTSISNSGTYTLTVTNEFGCSDLDTVELLNFPESVVDLGPAQTICLNHEITLDAGVGFIDYFWYNNGASTQSNTFNGYSLGIGTHTIEVDVEDANGCTGNGGVSITVDACTGIAEEETLATAIFPNPATTEINVAFDPSTVERITLINALGEQVSDLRITGAENITTINTADLAPGIYFLWLTHGSHTETHKVVVR